MRCFARVLAGVVAALCLAGPAQADSLVFVRDGNVWLANPDGSRQYQVTLDGTTASPYETPSLADDGTVVAIRAVPGQRRRIYRMTQSGGLLNPPVDTPAPGTGAIDAKVSPDGRLVAYWFVTTVNDPLCPFCVDTASRVLISRSDRFTGADEIGTPNTGGWPSWIGNDTLTLGSGSPTQWFYRLGMPEAAEWFTDSDVSGGQSFLSLLDAEVAPSGDRMAVVRGDNQESILLLRTNGAPPAKPSVANAACSSLTDPTGKFVDPTWSADGRTLAFQDDEGVWTGTVPADLADCNGFGSFDLRIPGARNPDLGRAPVNPGPRPGCGNPGNPAACRGGPLPPPPPCCEPEGMSAARKALRGLAKRLAPRLKRRGLLRRGGVAVAFKPASPGALTIRVRARGKVLLKGGRRYAAAKRARVRLTLTRGGRKALRRAGRRGLKATVRLRFAPTGGAAVSVSAGTRLRR